jgi:regulator of sigma E protease
MTVLYVIVAILILSFLVLVHEIGHYTAARLTGMPVHEFSIGFGTRLLSKKRKGTVYSLRLIPFGGYVSFADSDDEGAIANYYRQPVWKRMTMTLCGPLMNFVVAFLAGIIAVMVLGVVMTLPVVDTVAPGSAAEAAGLQSGDRFIIARGITIGDDVDLLREQIKSSQGNPFNVVVERDGKQLMLVMQAKYDSQQNAYIIGINMKMSDVPVKLGFGKAVVYSFNWMVTVVKDLLGFLGGLITQGKGADQVASPIGIVDMASQAAQQYGWIVFLNIGMFISVNLGLFNLLPLPALDGSKIVFLAIEGIRRKPIKPEREGLITAIGFGFFILLFIFLAGRDIARLFGWVT